MFNHLPDVKKHIVKININFVCWTINLTCQFFERVAVSALFAGHGPREVNYEVLYGWNSVLNGVDGEVIYKY
jgi:hypothetical protein